MKVEFQISNYWKDGELTVEYDDEFEEFVAKCAESHRQNPDITEFETESDTPGLMYQIEINGTDKYGKPMLNLHIKDRKEAQH